MASLRGRQRVTDDTQALVGDGMATQEEHASQINKTKKQELDPKMRTAHCRRLHAMMAFWEKEYPECYQSGARILTPEEVQNDMLF